MVCKATCYEIEYRANGVKVVDAKPNPNKEPCNSHTNKAAAEANAKTQLEAEMARKKETVDNCTKDEAGCSCKLPDWPVGGWNLTHAGLSSVQEVRIGPECTWKVILTYDREERLRSAQCK